MKKFALMFAALSLCACTFTACGDDDDSPSKAKKGESCEKVECDTGLTCNDSKVCEEKSGEVAKAKKGESCEKVECDTGLICNDSKVCEEKSGEAEKAKKGDSCAEKECDTGLKCNDSKICEEESTELEKAKKGESCEILDCEDELICDDSTKKCIEKPKAKAGEHCDKTEDCEENLTCEDHEGNKTCTKAASEGECFSNSDCKDPAKPVCGEGYKCVEAPSDLCDGKCTEGECVLGVCVTDAMKALKDGDDYPAGAADSFCNGNNVVYKGSDKKAHLADCSADGYTGCVVFSDDHNVVQADCNGQTAALDACKAAPQASQELDLWRIDTCLTSTSLYEVFCTKDLSGNDIAVPTYAGKNDKEAEDCGTCSIETDGPVCSK